MAITITGWSLREVNRRVPKLNRMPASMAAEMAAGSLPTIRSKAPDSPTSRMMALAMT
ncbi:hypothetical protein D3C81_1822670 [compost metagenome]